MPYYGEYVAPLTRVTNVQVPVISGYTTSRLYSADPIQLAISGTETSAMQVTFENVGDRFAFVALRQTQDTVSGPRVYVVSGVSLVPGGRAVRSTINAYMKYMELWCTDGGPTVIRMQIASQRRFEQMGFAKDADATLYPTSLWQAKPIPVATSV